MIKEQAIDHPAVKSRRPKQVGTSDGSNNKRLDGGWISEELIVGWIWEQ